MKRLLLLLLLLSFSFLLSGQNIGSQSYKIDLVNVVNDRVKVTVDASFSQIGNSISGFYNFHFPSTIPGTYASLDYGRFIKDFKAYDKYGELLTVTNKKNSFEIKGKPNRIEYWVEDTFDAKIRKNKVFEPAGTNNQQDQNFLINAAGYFGFFEGKEDLPVSLEITNSPRLFGISAMKNYLEKGVQVFGASNYHHFLDCPIMISRADTTSFILGGAKVTISVFSESGRELSSKIYDEVEESMIAIEKFLDGDLPVDNYAFIFYIKDYTEFEGLFSGKSISIGKILKAIRQLLGKGFGALEHGNSSVYYLPDFGGNSVLNMIKDVCIHEFFHILTPLGLHSEEIGNFDYITPKMSKHLWLYEGVTEYFAGLSQVQGGVISADQYIQKILRGKIKRSERFPNKRMSFTEMSENVLDNPYKKQYGQVYERGALIGALLDIRILELTKGNKSLKDVVLELRDKYGPKKSFKDSDIISEFVSIVNPQLQEFFDQYVTGKEDLPINEYLNKVGLIYNPLFKGKVIVDPLDYNNVKRFRSPLAEYYIIKKVGKKEFVGFKQGDKINKNYKKLLKTNFGFPDEGVIINLDVERDGETIQLPYKVMMKEGSIRYFLRELRNPSQSQQMLRALWLKSELKE